MDNKTRKVSFNYITFREDSQQEDIDLTLSSLITEIFKIDKKDRKLNISSEKFCFLDDFSISESKAICKLTFKTAKHSYRAPLIDKNTVEERDNPKTLDEGEVQKTHFLIKFKEGDAILFAEKYRGGLTVQQLIEYINSFVHKLYRSDYYSYFIIPKDNIFEELENLKRVSLAKIFVDKQVLGSDSLNFSRRIDTVQDDITVQIKADRGLSMKEFAKDILSHFSGGKRAINRVRIEGKNSTNNDVLIDTEFCEKREFVIAKLDEDTGEVNSYNLLYQLQIISDSY